MTEKMNQRSTCTFFTGLAAGLTACLGLVSAQAAERTFIGNNVSWSVPANWSGGALPGAGDTGIIAGTEGNLRTARFQTGGDLPGPPDAIRIQPFGVLSLWDATMATEHHLVLEGGRFHSKNYRTTPTTISLRSDSYLSSDPGGNTLTLTGVVQDYGAEKGMLIVDTGIVSLANNANSYSGGTRLEGGRAIAKVDNSFGKGPVEVLAGGSLEFQKVGLVLTNTLVVDGGGFYATANYSLFSTNWLKGECVLAGTGVEPLLSGLFRDFDAAHTGRLVKTGPGGYRISNPDNSYSGGTRIQEGKLILSVSDTLGTGPVEILSGGALHFNQTMSLKNPVVLDGGKLMATLNYNLTSTNWLKSESIIESTAAAAKLLGQFRDFDAAHTGRLVKTGTGTFIFSNSGPNTYSGGTLIKEGKLLADASTITPPTGDQPFGTGDVVVTNGATLHLIGITNATAPGASIFILSNATVRFHTQNVFGRTTNVVIRDGGHLYCDGTYLVGNYTSYDSVRLEGCVNLHRYQGVKGGAGYNLWYGTFADGAVQGQLAIVGTNSGQTELRGTYTYTGGTVIRDGGPDAAALTLAGGGRMPDTGAITVEANGVMNFNGISDTVGGLAGAGSVWLGSGTVTCSEGVSPGTNALAGCTLSVTGTTGRVVLGPDAVSTFHLRAPGDQDKVVLQGGANLTLDGDLKVEALDTLAAGEYVLFELDAGAPPSGSFQDLLLPARYAGKIVLSGNDVVLRVSRKGTLLKVY